MSTEVNERISNPNQANMIQVEVKMSLCTYDRLKIIGQSVAKCLPLPGELWEMGVYLGGSASLIGKLGPYKTLRLFDSFEGVSEPCEKDSPIEEVPGGELPMWKGEWHGDMKRALFNVGRECIVHKGWIPDTFVDVPKDAKVAFAHVDVDL